MRTHRIITIAAFGILTFAGSACTPQEVQQWLALHEQDPDTAIALLDLPAPQPAAASASEPAVRLEDDAPQDRPQPPQVVDTQTASSYEYVATVTCGPPTLHLANADDETLYYSVYYGTSQVPLFRAVQSDAYPNFGPPPIDVGETVTIDLTPSIGTTTFIALDSGWATGGVVAHVAVSDC